MGTKWRFNQEKKQTLFDLTSDSPIGSFKTFLLISADPVALVHSHDGDLFRILLFFGALAHRI